MTPLREVLEAEGGLLATALAAAGDPAPDDVARRAAAGRAEYALLVEAVREGHHLHTGEPRLVTGADPDLALLAGDRLYALGLARVAAMGDLEAVSELADVISLCAQAQADGDPGLARAAWEAGAAALAHGRGPDHPGAAATVQGQRGATSGPAQP